MNSTCYSFPNLANSAREKHYSLVWCILMKNTASSAKWEISSIALQINVEIANSLHLFTILSNSLTARTIS